MVTPAFAAWAKRMEAPRLLPDVNGRVNAAGVGINLAQRLMDCGDAGHILLSKRVAEDLQQNGRWRRHLHDLGEVEVKHRDRVHVFNFHSGDACNSEPPAKFIIRESGAVLAPRPIR